MNRRGVEFTLTQAEPGLWQWQFQINGTVKTGKTRTNLMGMAVHRVRTRIDLELSNPRNLGQSDFAGDHQNRLAEDLGI
jgi:hypothetical protein